MLKKHHRLLCFCRKQSVVGFGAQSPPGPGRLGVGTAGSGREMPLVPSRRWPWTVCACFPGQVGEFRGCHASLEGVAVPAVPLGLSSFLGKNRAGPRPPPPLPRAQPASDVCGTTPAGGGTLVGVPPPGAEGSQAPPGRCLVVAGCRSSRRPWSWLGAAIAITEERLVGQDWPRARPFRWETRAHC